MAISYSASASDKFAGVSSTRTLSITVNSGDTRMIAGIFASGGSSFTASYNGSAMTAVTSRTNGAYTMYAFELQNPTSGTHYITFNWSGNINGVMVAATYQGDNTSVAITNFASAVAATVNITAVTGWTVLLSGNHHTGTNTMTAGSGSTGRSISSENIDHDVAGIFDSNAQVGGATSMASSASGATYVSVIVTIPLLISSSVLDNITVADSQSSNMGQSFIDTVNADDDLIATDWETKAKSTAPTWTNIPKS
jgi:hypothetical protein